MSKEIAKAKIRNRLKRGTACFKSVWSKLQRQKFINKCFAKIESDELLTEEESQRYDRFFDLPGYQIDDAYLTIITEELL